MSVLSLLKDPLRRIIIWRKLRRRAMRLVCMTVGHKTYEYNDWGGRYLKCSRCDYSKVLWNPKRYGT